MYPDMNVNEYFYQEGSIISDHSKKFFDHILKIDRVIAIFIRRRELSEKLAKMKFRT